MKETMQFAIGWAFFHHGFMIPKLRFLGKIFAFGPRVGRESAGHYYSSHFLHESYNGAAFSSFPTSLTRRKPWQGTSKRIFSDLMAHGHHLSLCRFASVTIT